MNKQQAKTVATHIMHQLIQNFLDDGGCADNDEGRWPFDIETAADALKVDNALRDIQDRVLRNAPLQRTSQTEKTP